MTWRSKGSAPCSRNGIRPVAHLGHGTIVDVVDRDSPSVRRERDGQRQADVAAAADHTNVVIHRSARSSWSMRTRFQPGPILALRPPALQAKDVSRSRVHPGVRSWVAVEASAAMSGRSVKRGLRESRWAVRKEPRLGKHIQG